MSDKSIPKLSPKTAKSAPGSKDAGQAERESKPTRILVIQLARLGDTLQSLMALRAAKQLYPDLEVTVVVRERFAEAVKRVPWIERVVTLPTESLLGPILAGERKEAETVSEIARWVAPLIQSPWDMVVNWTFSEASSYLTGLVPGRIKLGFTRRKDATFASVDGWSHYIQAVIQGGAEQNIHLTDVLTTQLLTALQIHVGEPVNDGNAPVTSKSFFTLELGDRDLGLKWNDFSRKWIAIQLGASQPEKTWSAESWAELAAYILRRNPECSIVLLGGRDDAERAKTFQRELASQVGEQHLRNVLSLVGETDFDLWATVVSRCQWLMAGDTAAIHLASVLGTRVLNVSVGPVRWVETGPYGNGHYVVAAAEGCVGCAEKSGAVSAHTCRDSVTAEAVYATWTYASSEWCHRRQMSIESHFTNLGWRDAAPGVRILRSRIRGTQDGGGVVYEPMLKRALEIPAWSGMVMGHIARAWYCGWTPTVGQEIAREAIDPRLIKSLRGLRESIEVMSKVCDEAARIATTLNQKSSALPSDKVMRISDRNELRDLGNQLMELEGLVERLSRTHPSLLAFAQMSKVLMHNLKGNALSELGRETAINYRQLGEGIALLGQWVNHTLELARPVALRPLDPPATIEALPAPRRKAPEEPAPEPTI